VTESLLKTFFHYRTAGINISGNFVRFAQKKGESANDRALCAAPPDAKSFRDVTAKMVERRAATSPED
jgi:hypothetical protein